MCLSARAGCCFRALRLSSLLIPTRAFAPFSSFARLRLGLRAECSRQYLVRCESLQNCFRELLPSGSASLQNLHFIEHIVLRTEGLAQASKTNGRKVQPCFRSRSRQRSVWYLHMERSSDRSGGKAKTGMQLLATCPSPVRPRHERVVNADINIDIKESSKGGQRHVNQTSKSRQRDINGTSKSRQQIINSPSTEGLSRRDRRDVVFGGHKRLARRGLAGRITASG